MRNDHFMSLIISGNSQIIKTETLSVGLPPALSVLVLTIIFSSQILLQSKYTLLQCASPDAIARLPATKLEKDSEKLWTEYFINQKHGSLKDNLMDCLGDVGDAGSLIQVGFSPMLN